MKSITEPPKRTSARDYNRLVFPSQQIWKFVAIDFELVSLREGLQSSTLNFSEPAFFFCLGVLVYLSREAADAVFQLVASFPASSEIVFTLATLDSSLSANEAASRSALTNMANSLGEPQQTHFQPQTLICDPRALGFSAISFLTPEAADLIYFQSRGDGLRAPRRGGIGAAVVASHAGSREAGNPQQQ